MTPKVQRLGDQPIIVAQMDDRMGSNINGPSVIRAPAWLEQPLAAFYLYFADHKGSYIRLALADQITGPWRIHRPGALDLAQSRFATEMPDPAKVAEGQDFVYPHIASPDVHQLPERHEVRMYFHGLLDDGRQVTRVARSSDGLTFEVLPERLGPPYFRVFRYQDWHYALAWPNVLLRSADGLSGFTAGPRLGDPKTRHAAVLVRGDQLHICSTRIGDKPEQILHSTVSLERPWEQWRATEPVSLLKPELAWEGADEPLSASVMGAVDRPVRELRDPCLFEDEDRLYLLYSGAGESALGLAEVRGF